MGSYLDEVSKINENLEMIELIFKALDKFGRGSSSYERLKEKALDYIGRDKYKQRMELEKKKKEKLMEEYKREMEAEEKKNQGKQKKECNNVEIMCVICLEKMREAVFKPCKHLVTCEECV